MATGDRHGYFWQSSNGDRVYGADSFEKWLKKFFSTGVYANDCQVTAANGMNIQVATGYSNINGKVRVIDEAETLTVSPANTRYPRIDAVVIRRDNVNRTITTAVKMGSYSGASPIPPTPTRNESTYEIVLAHIYVAAGAIEITQADITDKREDTAVCGYITSPFTTIDLTQIVAQMEAQFGLWFDYMKDQLSEDAAGRLQQEIDALTERIDGMTTGGSVFEIYTQEPSLFYQPVNITSPRGTVYHGQFDSEGKAIIAGVTDVGQMTIGTTDGSQTATRTREVTYYSNYTIYINFFQATIDVSTTSSDLIGKTVTATKDGTSITGVFNINGYASIVVRSAGTYTLSVTSDGQTYTTTATITTDGQTVQATLDSWTATINMTSDSTFYGQSVMIYKNGTYVKTVTLGQDGTASTVLHESGTYTFTSYSSGTEQVDIEVNVASQTTYNIRFIYEPTRIYAFTESDNTDPSAAGIPCGAVTYPAGVENSNYTAATKATTGDWGSFLTDVLQNQPAMVKNDGTVDYYLDPTDYSKKANGDPSDYNDPSYQGAGAFAWIRNLWTKTVWDGLNRTVYFSNKKVDANYKRMIPNGKEGYWLPMGLSSAGTNPKSLISGTAYGTQVSGTTATFNLPAISEDNVKFFGGAIKNALRDIMVMMFKNSAASDAYTATKAIQLVGTPTGYESYTWVHSDGVSSYTPAIEYTNELLADTSGGLPGFRQRSSSNRVHDSKMFHSQVLPKFIYDDCIDADSLYSGSIRTSEDYGVTFTTKASFGSSPQTIGTNRKITTMEGTNNQYPSYASVDCGNFGATGDNYDLRNKNGRTYLFSAQGANGSGGAGTGAYTMEYQSGASPRRAYSSINALGAFHDQWDDVKTITSSSTTQHRVGIMGLYTAITVIPPNDYSPAV